MTSPRCKNGSRKIASNAEVATAEHAAFAPETGDFLGKTAEKTPLLQATVIEPS